MQKITAIILKQGPLSPKEAVVLRYLCEGCMRKEIALKVCRTPSTVGKQIESIAEKFDCHSAAEIVATAVAAGMVSIQIKQENSLFGKCLVMLLMCNVVFSHMDMRRGPSSPRPARTSRTTSRVNRSQRQYP